MDISQLREYKNWIDKSPIEIRKAVTATGGWTRVFPMKTKFPEWASWVRNFFNVTPVTLERLSSAQADRQKIKNRRGYNVIKPFEFEHLFALNGAVYVDETGRPWFDMAKVGTVYHFPGKVDLIKKAEALGAQLHRYPMPVFKLISPDDTGGSLELCTYNRNGSDTIGKVGEKVHVSPRLVSNEVYRGSYNYSETVIRGLPEHEYRDVEPHKDDIGFYVNPPIDSPISGRRFPARFNGHPWEYEFGLEPFEFDHTRPDPPLGKVTITDPLAELMAQCYPPNHPGSLERVKGLEQLFHRTRACYEL